ncbi:MULTISPECIES: hypothetical protein [Haloarcula]|uniref:hypothetical protein n=1 Tax=Haloarcula TaxID=2237 RepID=UPI0023EB0088|nr:hypothetical protein [Halomicroarcula sp. XH51]
MPKNNNVMVVAGQAGSKSTFIGGLYRHAHRADDINVTYRKKEGNVEEDFFDGVIKRMNTRGVYPDQTTEGYVVELTLSQGSSLVPDIDFQFVDIPGEQIDIVLSNIWDEVKNDAIDESRVESEFQSVRSKIGGDEALDIGDWETIFKHYYSQASMILFLVNFHKMTIRDEEPTFDSDVLESVSRQKVKTALVPTAVDLLDYDPSTPDMKSKAMFSARTYDRGLDAHLDDKLKLGDVPKVQNLLDHVEQNERIAFFSTAVPPADPTNPKSDKLARDNDGGFVTKGFDEVVTWLRD